jgi:hypothetical protein
VCQGHAESDLRFLDLIAEANATSILALMARTHSHILNVSRGRLCRYFAKNPARPTKLSISTYFERRIAGAAQGKLVFFVADGKTQVIE